MHKKINILVFLCINFKNLIENFLLGYTKWPVGNYVKQSFPKCQASEA